MKNKHPKRLALYKNPVGDEGAKLIAQHQALKVLNLRECGIGDQGAVALAKNKVLTALTLRQNLITDTGASEFINNRTLRHLKLSRNKITEELVYNIEYLMPSNGYLNLLDDQGGSLARAIGDVKQKDTVRILSIDGGGICGLLPALILEYIFKELNKRLGGTFHFAQHLDLFAGTSTGALISLGLTMPEEHGRPKYTPDTLVDLYTKKGADIFPATWSLIRRLSKAEYSAQPLEAVLMDYFGHMKISSCMCHSLISAFSIDENKSHAFDSLEARKHASKNYEIRAVARSTFAAPTYFPQAVVKNEMGEEHMFVDGGIYANNPTLLALQLAKKLYPHAKEYVVISLGTGTTITRGKYADLSDAGLIGWGVNIANVLMHNMREYTHTLLNTMIAEDQRIRFYRIQPQLADYEMGMDNASPQNIKNLTLAAQAAIETHKEMLDSIMAEFVKDYRA